MIDPAEPLDVQIARQARIIDALVRRAQRGTDVGGSAYSIFQSAISLQGAVWEKTRDLERALDTLGRTSHELESARFARQYLQATFDEMPSGVCSLSRAGEVQIHNARFTEFLGLPPGLMQKGTPLRDILDCLFRVEVLYHQKENAESGRWLEELREKGDLARRIRHKSGTVIDIRIHRMPDRGFLAAATDVTLETRATALLEKRVSTRTAELTRANRKLREQHDMQARVEEDLRLAKEQAEAAIRARTRFLAAASHDLLQPVNAAKLLISTLVDRLGSSEHEAAVERLAGSFASIEQLLTSLLDISRLESTETDLTVTRIRLDTLMRTLKRDYAPMAEAKGIRFECVPSTIWVLSDRRYLLRSLQNLVVNAIQYTDQGRVLLGVRAHGGVVSIEVWDTGIGIPRKDQARIFEEFTRADGGRRLGLGLGLSIVNHACRQLGHKIRVRSKPGIGSVFSLEVKRCEPGHIRENGGNSARHADGPKLSQIVLVVENDADALHAMVQRLEAWGASVLGAASTIEALRLVDEIGMPPDIVLADYRLDDDDTGVAAIAALRKRTGCHVPAILVTAERGKWLEELGARQDIAVLTKPVRLSRLRSLMEWQAQRQSFESVVEIVADEGLP